jgi:hypothetical protein
LFANAAKPLVAGLVAEDEANAEVVAGVENADWPNAGCPNPGLLKAAGAAAPAKAAAASGAVVPRLFFVACSKTWKPLLRAFFI